MLTLRGATIGVLFGWFAQKIGGDPWFRWGLCPIYQGNPSIFPKGHLWEQRLAFWMAGGGPPLRESPGQRSEEGSGRALHASGALASVSDQGAGDVVSRLLLPEDVKRNSPLPGVYGLYLHFLGLDHVRKHKGQTLSGRSFCRSLEGWAGPEDGSEC